MLGFKRDDLNGILLSLAFLSEYREKETEEAEKQKQKGSKSRERSDRITRASGKHMKNVPKRRK